jgi:hypothetical protein
LLAPLREPPPVDLELVLRLPDRELPLDDFREPVLDDLREPPLLARAPLREPPDIFRDALERDPLDDLRDPPAELLRDPPLLERDEPAEREPPRPLEADRPLREDPRPPAGRDELPAAPLSSIP